MGNKAVILFITSFVCCNSGISQEQFLKLDSIVIVEEQLNMTTDNSAVYNSGIDSLTVQVAPNQVVNIRYIGLGITNQAPLGILFKRSTSRVNEYAVSKLSISLGNYCLLNGVDGGGDFRATGSPTINWDNDNSLLGLGKRFIDRHPDLFMNKDVSLIIDFEYNKAPAAPFLTVEYRIELVYYSYAP